MVLTLGFKSHLDHKSKGDFYKQGVAESNYRRTENVGKEILITFRFGDRKVTQLVRTTSGLPQEQGI